MQEIKCRQCGKVKPSFDFFKRTDSKSGFSVRCKECSRQNRINNSWKRRKILTESKESRFWRFVEKSENCWLWTGCMEQNLPIFSWSENGKKYKPMARPFAYELQIGKLERNTVVITTCGNPRCVRGEHLKCITKSERLRQRFLPPDAEEQRAKIQNRNKFNLWQWIKSKIFRHN